VTKRLENFRTGVPSSKQVRASNHGIRKYIFVAMTDQENKTENTAHAPSRLLKRYYRVDEVADYFSISVRTVYRLLDEGDLQAARIRKCVRISSAEIVRFEKILTED